MLRRTPFMAVGALAVVVPAVLAATAARILPTQRVDVKVLLISADGTETVILATGDLGHNVTNANGTISYLSALSDTEWAALVKFERTFGIRRLSDYTARSPAHGVNTVAGATKDGSVGTLTPAGKAAFPYLNGPVPIANDDPIVAESLGYAATPVNATSFRRSPSRPSLPARIELAA